MKKKFYTEEELVFKEKSKRPDFQHLDGLKFGRLTVLGFAGKMGRNATWFCKCECGKITKVQSGALKNGHTSSCDCLRKEMAMKACTMHGHNGRNGKRSRIYQAWASMIQRCNNPNSIRYYDYGGRGIKVCERWKKFENFLEDMGERPRRTSIDRIDNDGNYEPGNCRWATDKEQANNKRNNRFLFFDGSKRTVGEWAERIGINRSTLIGRLNKGWDTKKALTTPIRKY